MHLEEPYVQRMELYIMLVSADSVASLLLFFPSQVGDKNLSSQTEL